MGKRFLVVGGDEIALDAAVKARIQDSEAKIKLFASRGSFFGRRHEAWLFDDKDIKDLQALKQRLKEFYKSEFDIEICDEYHVSAILPMEKKIVVCGQKEKTEINEEYDKLILATGTVPVYPSVEGVSLENVFFLQSMEDVLDIRRLVDKGDAYQAVIVGGSLKAVEVAGNLHANDVLVTIVESGPHLLPDFDAEIGELARKHLEEKGVEVLTGEKVLTLIGNAKGEVVEVHTPDHIKSCSLVIWVTDEKPDTSLAEAAGIAVDETGAIQVKQDMETSIPCIYGVGDCARNGHWENNLKIVTGRVFDLYASKTGLSFKEALDKGFQAEAILVSAHDGPGYHPVSGEIAARLVVDKESRRVLGAQFLGENYVDKYAYIVSTLIGMEGVLDDLLAISGHTPYMQVILMAANALLHKIEGTYDTISPVELHEMVEDEELLILDTRTAPEVTMGTVPDAIHIPIDELEERIGELDSGKTVVLVSKRDNLARRAYNIIKKAGFTERILEGGIAAYPYDVE